MRLFDMDLRHTRWTLVLLFTGALSACDIGPGGPLGLGGNNGGLDIGGRGGGGGSALLSFTVQPSTATGGNIIPPPVLLRVADSLGHVDSRFPPARTLTI